MGSFSDKISQISYLLHGNRSSLHFDVCWLASVEPRPLTVKVKSPDTRDSTNDQKTLPRADLLRQIPRPPDLPLLRLNIDRCIKLMFWLTSEIHVTNRSIYFILTNKISNGTLFYRLFSLFFRISILFEQLH